MNTCEQEDGNGNVCGEIAHETRTNIANSSERENGKQYSVCHFHAAEYDKRTAEYEAAEEDGQTGVVW